MSRKVSKMQNNDGINIECIISSGKISKWQNIDKLSKWQNTENDRKNKICKINKKRKAKYRIGMISSTNYPSGKILKAIYRKNDACKKKKTKSKISKWHNIEVA